MLLVALTALGPNLAGTCAQPGLPNAGYVTALLQGGRLLPMLLPDRRLISQATPAQVTAFTDGV